ncbi:MAG: molybdopterin-binding protein [Thermomicrobiales bacterium]
MEAFVIDPAHLELKDQLLDAIICEEVKANGRRLFRKGHRVAAGDLDTLATLERPIHALRLGPRDVHEDDAGIRLGEAIAGEGVKRGKPVQSRVNLRAERKGLLRVDAEALLALNRQPGIAIFALPDRLPVLPGKILAGAKITPVAIDEAILAEAEQIAGTAPIVQVKPFQPMKVGVITTEGLQGDACDRFQTSVIQKIDWFGGEVLGFVDLPNDPDLVAGVIERFLADGAELIMTGGGNTIDPLDATLLALPKIGGEIVKFGAPAHPGSMFWLAYRGETPIFNLASCSMYSKATVADLLLPWIMAGEKLTLDDMAGIGYGGLLDRDMSYRFPPYEADAREEPDEA